MGYRTVDPAQDGDAYEAAQKKTKAMWSLARREFGIKDSYRVMLAACNDDTLAKLTGPYSHVLPRKDDLPMVILRVSKDEVVSPDFGTVILPREFANVVCKINPSLGCPYRRDAGWQKVVKKLSAGVDKQHTLS